MFADISEANIAAAAEESKKYATDVKYQALAITLDVTNVESVRFLVNTAVETFGKIDYLVNSAGVSTTACLFNVNSRFFLILTYLFRSMSMHMFHITIAARLPMTK